MLSKAAKFEKTATAVYLVGLQLAYIILESSDFQYYLHNKIDFYF